MRDIVLNGAAIGSGLLFSVALDPPVGFRAGLRPGSLRRGARFAGVVVVAIAAFFHSVHLGHEIHDGEIGTFRSRYSARALAEVSAQRAQQWLTRPPPLTVPRVSREDQFLTEGIEHVMERNDLWAEGDAAGAWFENRILEKYFAPVVDTPSYHAKTGSRWPDEQRRNAQLAATLAAGASLEPRAFVSRSNPAPIYTWPKGVYWLTIAVVVGVLLAGSAVLDRGAPPVARRDAGGLTRPSA
jgi:hypothetical protein